MPPSIALVTPSLNQRDFIEEALRSVLDQGYPALEYVVADGGSTDGSAEVIERHADRLARWWSEPDAGHAAAVSRALESTRGEIMGWLNSDDLLLPGALHLVGEIFEAFPHVEWLTAASRAWIDERSRIVAVHHTVGYHREPFLHGLHGIAQTGRRFGSIQQESTFWRRRLWDAAGGRLDVTAEPAADFELWVRFFEHAELYTVATVIGAFRVHAGQRTARELGGYLEQARSVVATRSEPLRRPARLALRARAAVPGRIAERLGIGWEVPVITWDRAASRWREGRRLLR